MNRAILHHRPRMTLWLAAIAVLFAALSPTLNAWRAEGQPKLFAALCTSMGLARVAADDNPLPAKQLHHGPECAWCLAPASLLALSDAGVLPIPAAGGRDPAPSAIIVPLFTARHHAFAWAQAPPVFS